MSFIKRFIAFVWRYRTRPSFLFLYACNYLNPTFVARASFFEPDSFIESIKKGKSFSRLGDGEIHIMNGHSLPAQRYSRSLENSLRAMVTEYTISSPYIVGFSRFINIANVQLREKNLFYIWYPAKILYRIFFPKNIAYGDAHFFYYDGFFQKYLESYLMDKHLIVVSNEKNVDSLKTNKNVPFKKISFVVTSPKDAYDSLESISKNIDACLEKAREEGDIPVIILAAGPASKVLVYNYSFIGVQSLDIGTGFEVLYRDQTLETTFESLKQFSSII